jgi:hypothetical protein
MKETKLFPAIFAVLIVDTSITMTLSLPCLHVPEINTTDKIPRISKERSGRRVSRSHIWVPLHFSVNISQ